MAYLCDKCNEQFAKTPRGRTEWLEHRASHSQGKAPETATAVEVKKSMSAKEIVAEKKAKVDPLKLEYKWDGYCPKCIQLVETIVIEAGQPKGKVVSVAFCTRCKKDIAHKQVDKL